MTTLVTKGNWNIANGKIKQALARLARDNLQLTEGKLQELVGRIQKRNGQARKRLEFAADDGDEGGGHQ